MGARTTSKPDRTIEARPWSSKGEDPLLVAALAAALVEYRRHVSRPNGEGLPGDSRYNWHIMTRVAQLQRLP